MITLKWFRKKYIQRTYICVYTYTEVVYVHECIGIYRDIYVCVYIYMCIYISCVCIYVCIYIQYMNKSGKILTISDSG